MQVVATAGHVDHGKSALLRRLTGMEPDRWAEERRRGLTIDLGYVWTELPTPDGDPVDVAIVDVPGHDDFLANMLCGVGVVEQVLFVVAADDGWAAQSQEHLEILDLLGRRGLVAVVTKSELAGPDRTADVVADVRSRLVGTSLEDTPVLAVDSLSAAGIDALTEVLAARLATPPGRAAAGAGSAAGAVGVRSETASPGADATRLWVDRAFTVRGVGTVVTGMLVAGHLEVGQDVEVAPHGTRGRIRGLHQLERDVPSADAGARVAVNLVGVDLDAVGRGDALVVPGAGPRRREGPAAVDVHLRALPHAGIGRRGAWHVHVGTAATTARVLPVLDDLEPGGSGPVRLELAEPLPLRVGDRFVLREAGRRRTVGGGVVLDPAPTGRRRGTEQRLEHALVLERLAETSDVAGRIGALVDAHSGTRPLDDLRAAFGIDVTGSLPADVEVLAEVAVRRDRVEAWTDGVCAEAATAEPGTAVDLARLTAAAARAGCPAGLAAAVVDRAVRAGRLHRHGGRLVHGEHEAAYLAARDERRNRFLDVLRADPWAPPDPAEAARQIGLPSFEVQDALDEGEVIACGGLLFAATAIESAVERLRDGPGRDGATFSASDARQAWGVSRRSALPLLEHLRATGVTTFDGTDHRLTSAGSTRPG